MKVPALHTVGEFEEADPAMIEHVAALTPGATVVVIPGSAHITTWDNPTAMTAAVRALLRHGDSTSTGARK